VRLAPLYSCALRRFALGWRARRPGALR